MINRLPFGRGVSTRQLHQDFYRTAAEQLYFCWELISKKRSPARKATVYIGFVPVVFVFVCGLPNTFFIQKPPL